MQPANGARPATSMTITMNRFIDLSNQGQRVIHNARQYGENGVGL
jgi:hypothetical protein